MPEMNIAKRIDQRTTHHAQQMEIRLQIAQMTSLYLQQFARDACDQNWPLLERKARYAAVLKRIDREERQIEQRFPLHPSSRVTH